MPRGARRWRGNCRTAARGRMLRTEDSGSRRDRREYLQRDSRGRSCSARVYSHGASAQSWGAHCGDGLLCAACAHGVGGTGGRRGGCGQQPQSIYAGDSAGIRDGARCDGAACGNGQRGIAYVDERFAPCTGRRFVRAFISLRGAGSSRCTDAAESEDSGGMRKPVLVLRHPPNQRLVQKSVCCKRYAAGGGICRGRRNRAGFFGHQFGPMGTGPIRCKPRNSTQSCFLGAADF